MFKKRVVYFSLILNIGGLFWGKPSITFAMEEKKNVPVTYKNFTDITDPENPENPEYMIIVPAAIVFTDTHKKVDSTVSMVKPDGTNYDGEKSLKVEVTSKNEFQLVNDNYQVSYKLLTIDEKDKENLVTNNNNTIGIFNKNNTSVKGSARLFTEPEHRGRYSDILTYKVSQNKADK